MDVVRRSVTAAGIYLEKKLATLTLWIFTNWGFLWTMALGTIVYSTLSVWFLTQGGHLWWRLLTVSIWSLIKVYLPGRLLLLKYRGRLSGRSLFVSPSVKGGAHPNQYSVKKGLGSGFSLVLLAGFSSVLDDLSGLWSPVFCASLYMHIIHLMVLLRRREDYEFSSGVLQAYVVVVAGMNTMSWHLLYLVSVVFVLSAYQALLKDADFPEDDVELPVENTKPLNRAEIVMDVVITSLELQVGFFLRILKQLMDIWIPSEINVAKIRLWILYSRNFQWIMTLSTLLLSLQSSVFLVRQVILSQKIVSLYLLGIYPLAWLWMIVLFIKDRKSRRSLSISPSVRGESSPHALTNLYALGKGLAKGCTLIFFAGVGKFLDEFRGLWAVLFSVSVYLHILHVAYIYRRKEDFDICSGFLQICFTFFCGICPTIWHLLPLIALTLILSVYNSILKDGAFPPPPTNDVMPTVTGHEKEEVEHEKEEVEAELEVIAYEKEEVEAELEGRKLLNIVFPEGHFGTKEAPAIMKSCYDKRTVGCSGGEGEDEHDVVWFRLEKGKSFECPVCTQYFELEVVGPGGPPDGHGDEDNEHHH